MGWKPLLAPVLLHIQVSRYTSKGHYRQSPKATPDPPAPEAGRVHIPKPRTAVRDRHLPHPPQGAVLTGSLIFPYQSLEWKGIAGGLCVTPNRRTPMVQATGEFSPVLKTQGPALFLPFLIPSSALLCETLSPPARLRQWRPPTKARQRRRRSQTSTLVTPATPATNKAKSITGNSGLMFWTF